MSAAVHEQKCDPPSEQHAERMRKLILKERASALRKREDASPHTAENVRPYWASKESTLLTQPAYPMADRSKPENCGNGFDVNQTVLLTKVFAWLVTNVDEKMHRYFIVMP